MLILGVNGLALEAGKNLVLSGTGEVFFCDEGRKVTEADVGADRVLFYLDATHLGQGLAEALRPALQDLNPHVKVHALSAVPLDLTAFDLVAYVGGSVARAVTLSQQCRAAEVKFLAAAAWGFHAWALLDLGNAHKFTESHPRKRTPDMPKDVDPGKEDVPLEFAYKPLDDVLGASWDARVFRRLPPLFYVLQAKLASERDGVSVREAMDKLLKDAGKDWDSAPRGLTVEALDQIVASIGIESMPVCAITGGLVAADIGKIVSGKGTPTRNTLLLDTAGRTGGVSVFIG